MPKGAIAGSSSGREFTLWKWQTAPQSGPTLGSPSAPQGRNGPALGAVTLCLKCPPFSGPAPVSDGGLCFRFLHCPAPRSALREIFLPVFGPLSSGMVLVIFFFLSSLETYLHFLDPNPWLDLRFANIVSQRAVVFHSLCGFFLKAKVLSGVEVRFILLRMEPQSCPRLGPVVSSCYNFSCASPTWCSSASGPL